MQKHRNTPARASEPRWHYRHLVRQGCGWLCILLGVLGLFLPILQGLLFLALGSLLLAPYIPFFHRMKLGIYKRFPRVRWTAERWRRKLKARLARP